MLKTVTKTLELPVALGEAFPYLADVALWPEWATFGVRSATPVAANVWAIVSFRGQGRVVMRSEARWGILDHDFTDSEGNTWPIPTRLVPLTGGCLLIRTFSQPAAMPDAGFAQLMGHVDEEMQNLRAAVARRRRRQRDGTT